MFDFILNPLKWVIDSFFSLTGSHAMAIILFTLVIKLVLLPLDMKQRRSTRRMSKLQPKIDSINKRYANDPDKKAQKTMELYKKEKVSMFSSCLPMLLQFPILIAMVTVMNRVAYDGMMQMFLDANAGLAPTVERFLWVTNIFQPDNLTAPVLADLNTIVTQIERASSAIITPENIQLLKDNYVVVMTPYMEQYANLSNGLGILPVLSGALQFLQTKLMPQQPGAEPSKNQKMFTYLMPVVSVFFCWSFNAAFALYWVVSSLYSILQNLILNYYYKKKDEKEQAEGVVIT